MIVKEGSIYKADEETTKLILDTQKETLQYMKLNNMYELMQDKKKLKEFNKIMKLELSFNYYFAYDIIVGDKAIQIEYDNILSERKELNKLMIDKSNKLFDKDKFVPFITDYNKLINMLIDTNDKDDIKELLEEKKSENDLFYIAESLMAGKEYNDKINNITSKYTDTYKD